MCGLIVGLLSFAHATFQWLIPRAGISTSNALWCAPENLDKLLFEPRPITQYRGISQCWFDSLQWRHNERHGVSNHPPHDYLLNRLSSRRSKKTSKLRGTGLCAGNSPVTGEFPAQGPVTRKMFPFDDVIMSAKWNFTIDLHSQIKENIKAPRHRPLWGEFTGHRWIPRTKDQ